MPWSWILVLLPVCSLVPSQERRDTRSAIERALRGVDADLARRPRDPVLLLARVHLLLARGSRDEAAGTGRRLVPLLPPGIGRTAVELLVATLGKPGGGYGTVLERACIRRGRGATTDLAGDLDRLAKQGAPAALVAFARGELCASYGHALDKARARRALERFLGVAGEDTVPLLRRYLAEPRLSLAAARERAQRWIVQLEAGEEIFPPPLVDRRAWERRRRRLLAAKERASRRVADHEARIRRLEKQRATLGDPRRKDGPRNRQQIRWDIRQNEKAIARARAELATLAQVLARVRRVLDR